MERHFQVFMVFISLFWSRSFYIFQQMLGKCSDCKVPLVSLVLNQGCRESFSAASVQHHLINTIIIFLCKTGHIPLTSSNVTQGPFRLRKRFLASDLRLLSVTVQCCSDENFVEELLIFSDCLGASNLEVI